jgi:hypothetical protein
VGGRQRVKDIPNNNRIGFQAAFFSRVVHPRDGETLDVFTVDLRKVGVMIPGIMTIVNRPVVRFLGLSGAKISVRNQSKHGQQNDGAKHLPPFTEWIDAALSIRASICRGIRFLGTH